MNVRLKVVHKKDTTPIESTKEAFVTLFKILQDLDEELMLAKYKGAVEQGDEEAIKKIIDLPSTIGGLKRYANALRPVKKGRRMVWTSIKLRHNVPILELIDYARDDLREKDFGVYIQPVQHHDVLCIGWLLFLHGDSEIAFWQRLLDKELQEKTIKRI